MFKVEGLKLRVQSLGPKALALTSINGSYCRTKLRTSFSKHRSDWRSWNQFLPRFQQGRGRKTSCFLGDLLTTRPRYAIILVCCGKPRGGPCLVPKPDRGKPGRHQRNYVA